MHQYIMLVQFSLNVHVVTVIFCQCAQELLFSQFSVAREIGPVAIANPRAFKSIIRLQTQTLPNLASTEQSCPDVLYSNDQDPIIPTNILTSS